MSEDHGDEYDEHDDVPPPKGSSRILIVSGIVAALVLIGAAVTIVFELHSADRGSAGVGSSAALGPDVRVIRSACAGCPIYTLEIDRTSWADRLPQGVTLSLDKMGTSAYGELQLEGARAYVIARYAGTPVWDAECQVRAVGDAPLTQAALDFLKGCVTATIPDTDSDLLSATRVWLESRFRPANTWQPQVGWGCGYLVVDFLLDRGGADVVISARDTMGDAAAAAIPDGCREH